MCKSLFPAESFNSLLKSYTPSSQVASPTMADVLQELPEQTDFSPSSPEVDRSIKVADVNSVGGKRGKSKEIEFTFGLSTFSGCADEELSKEMSDSQAERRQNSLRNCQNTSTMSLVCTHRLGWPLGRTGIYMSP